MDVSNPIDWIRVIAGLFFVPHIAAKLMPPRVPLEFFRAVGFSAPLQVMHGAALIEVLVCIGLIFAVVPAAAAWLGAVYLLCACASVLKVGSQHPWLWNGGGIEYPAFWAAICIVIALAY